MESDTTLTVIGFIWGGLIIAPPVAFLISTVLRLWRPNLVRKFVYGCVIYIGIVVIFLLYGISFSDQRISAGSLATVYLAYCCLVVSSLKISRLAVRIPVAVVGITSIALGYMLASVGALGLAFIIGDTIPVFNQQVSPGITCRVTTYGTVFTSRGGQIAHLEQSIPYLPFLEREVYELRFEDSTGEGVASPTETCTRAVAEHAG